jgi:flagellar biosynthesis protein FlhB
MSAASDPDKTEKPSPQKLRTARAEGQVARSRDWTTALGLCIALQLIVLQMPSWLIDFRRLFASSFPPLGGQGSLENAWSDLFSQAMLLTIKMILPLFAVPILVCCGSLFPGGWTFTPALWAPKLGRLAPANYFGRLLKPKSLADTITAVAKAAALMIVLVYVVRGNVAPFIQLQSQPLTAALHQGTRLLLNASMALCAVFVVIAIIDLPVQMLLFTRSQRMSKREARDEHKTNEGRPEVRQRVRQLQLQMSRRAVRKLVPTADVVIVNPEHYAVALKYDEMRAQAPFVIAKGMDEVALYIRQVAMDHSVEVLSLPPLARAIYHTSQVNQQIPAALYEAVARVLTYVFQIQAFRTGRRPSRPKLTWSDLTIPPHLSTPPT